MSLTPYIRRSLFGLTASALLVVSGCSSSLHAEVGQCISMEDFPEGEEVSHLPTVECSKPHTMEIFAVEEISKDFDPANDIQMAVIADEVCRPAFKAYVGIDLDESELDYVFFHPSEEGKEKHDDRQLVCAIMATEEVTTSYRDTEK